MADVRGGAVVGALLPDQLVRKFKDGLGIYMTMKKYIIFVSVQQYKPEVGSPLRGARSSGHDSIKAVHTAATST